MKKCPLCKIRLVSKMYEGCHLWHCPECFGHLLQKNKFELIKRLRLIESLELVANLRTHYRVVDTRHTACPRCYRTMRRRGAISLLHLRIDFCKECKLLWLDGGELEALQVQYELSAQGKEDLELMLNADAFERDPERIEAFQENMSKLPLDFTCLPSEMEGDPFDVLLRIILRERMKVLKNSEEWKGF